MTEQEILKAKAHKLSSNFSLFEAIASESRPDLVTYPSQDIITKLEEFYKNIVQPTRDKFGRLKIQSGYRNKVLNSAIGGEKRSVHQIYDGSIFIGVASDINPLEADILEVYEWMYANLPVKCLILYRNPKVTRTKFIHADTGVYRNTKTRLEKVSAGNYVFFGGK